MKILVKFPSRERPDRFQNTLQQMMHLSVDKDIKYLITLDRNDPTVNQYVNIIKELSNCRFIIGDSFGKIHAINRDMNQVSDYDILILASDDMVPIVQGWDNIIREEMQLHFFPTPEEKYNLSEGVIWYDDGYKSNINMMPIMTKAAYDRFGYIYHPAYVSLFCDNEMTEVWSALNCQIKRDLCLFQHQHYARSSQWHHTIDPLMRRNESYFMQDRKTYNTRKALNFGL